MRESTFDIILFSIFLILTFIAVCYFDIREMIVPDTLNATLAAVGLVMLLTTTGTCMFLTLVMAALVGVVLIFLRWIFFKLRDVQGLGLGDVKFISAATLWVGVVNLPGMVLLACLTAIATHVVVSLYKKNYRWSRRIPFGPHLAFALFITWSIGPVDQMIFGYPTYF